MQVDIYKAKKSPGPREKQYIMVKSGAELSVLPDDIKQQTGDLLFFKTMTIKRGDKRIALDVNEAILNIEAQGYHVQGTKIEIHISTGVSNNIEKNG